MNLSLGMIKMAHERQTEYNGYTIYVDCCYYCPHLEEEITFKSCIDEKYNVTRKICNKTRTIIHNELIIPIECPLPPRYRE